MPQRPSRQRLSSNALLSTYIDQFAGYVTRHGKSGRLVLLHTAGTHRAKESRVERGVHGAGMPDWYSV